MINDFFALLADVPPRTALMWAAWLTAGLMLNLWHRRSRQHVVVHDGYGHASTGSRPKSGVRPPSGGARKPAPKSTPFTTGDAFGDLEALLDKPEEPTPSGSHRRPGDSPILSEAPQALASPRALP